MQKKRRRNSCERDVVEFRTESILRLNSPFAQTFPDEQPSASSSSECSLEIETGAEKQQNVEAEKEHTEVLPKHTENETSQIQVEPKVDCVKVPRLDNTVAVPKQSKSYSIHSKGALYGTRYVILQLRTGTSINVNGSAWMSVISGSVYMMGATVGAEDGPVLITSAPIAPFAVRLTGYKDGVETNRIVTKKKGGDVARHMQVREKLLKKIEVSKSRCVVLFTEVMRDAKRWVEEEWSDLIYSIEPFMREMGIRGVTEGEALFEKFWIAERGNVFAEWEGWESVTQSLDSSIAKEEMMRIVVCGGSGTGKSTFVRCLCNYLVCKMGGVVLIDSDVGQAELNVSGLVGAYEIRELRIGGAGGRHVPFCGRYFGEITAREDTDVYAEYVEKVVLEGRKKGEELGLAVVVNCDGWVSGVGLQLLDHLKRCVAATHLVETRVGGVEKSGLQEVRRGVDKVFVMESGWEGRDRVYSGGVQRELLVCGYLSGELGSGRVYKVEQSQVELVWCAESSGSWWQLNGCLVALGHRDGHDWNVRGFAIVRGVECTAHGNVLYVATPVPKEVLHECTAVLIGAGVQLPHSVFVASARKWLGASRKTPYVMSGAVGTAEWMRSRPTLNRR